MLDVLLFALTLGDKSNPSRRKWCMLLAIVLIVAAQYRTGIRGCCRHHGRLPHPRDAAPAQQASPL